MKYYTNTESGDVQSLDAWIGDYDVDTGCETIDEWMKELVEFDVERFFSDFNVPFDPDIEYTTEQINDVVIGLDTEISDYEI